jgi:predicted GIY-YIG superfamily endonuclease
MEDSNEVIAEYLALLRNIMSAKQYEFKKPQSEVPTTRGVYIIYDDKPSILYVGRTKNLRRRLLSNHLGNETGNKDRSRFRRALKSHLSENSQFRRAMKKDFGLSEDELSDYIRKNCTFSFLQISEAEIEVRLEHFATAILGPILNTKLLKQ